MRACVWAVKDNVKEVIGVLQTYETEYKKYPPYSNEQQEYYFQLRNARNNIIPVYWKHIEYIFLYLKNNMKFKVYEENNTR